MIKAGLEILSEADLVMVFFRRIALNHEQMEMIKSYLNKGKPLIGIRTANHAFSVRDEVPEANGHSILKGFEPASWHSTGNIYQTAPLLDGKATVLLTGKGFIRQSITFVSEPGDRIPALLYIPSGVKKEDKLPAMLTLHPTGPLGKLIVAREGPLDNRQYGLELMQRGYVVLCPDYPYIW